MAQLSMKLEVRFSWWVHPYLWCLWVLCYAVAPFLDEDDPTIDHLLEVHAEIICRYGVRCVTI